MAALSAAGVLTSSAQVFSVNIVGYVNLSIPAKKAALIANQLNNKLANGTIDNTLGTLVPLAANGSAFYKWVGSGFSTSAAYDTGCNCWTDPTLTLNPGEGGLLFNNATTPLALTFVGEVQLSSSLLIPTVYSVQSSVIPQTGFIHLPTGIASPDGNPDLQFGQPQEVPNAAGESFYQYVVANQGFSTSYLWDSNGHNWGDGTNPGPEVQVGEAFLTFIPPAGGTHTWARTFSVGP
jgi:hypothetical protein